MATKEYTRVITPKARLSFPHLFKAVENKERPEAAPKFSATLLVPKGEDISELKAIAKAALVEEFGEDATFGEDYRSPLRDGNK